MVSKMIFPSERIISPWTVIVVAEKADFILDVEVSVMAFEIGRPIECGILPIAATRIYARKDVLFSLSAATSEVPLYRARKVRSQQTHKG